MEGKENVYFQQFNENKIFKVEEEMLIIPYYETPNEKNTYSASNIENAYAKLPSADYKKEESTNRINPPGKEEIHVVAEKPQWTHSKRRNFRQKTAHVGGVLKTRNLNKAIAVSAKGRASRISKVIRFKKEEQPKERSAVANEPIKFIKLNFNDLKRMNFRTPTADDGLSDTTTNENTALIATDNGKAKGQASAIRGFVQENMRKSSSTTDSTAKIQPLLKIISKAKKLFEKTNWRLCHWIHPTAPSQHIQQILDDMWATISCQDMNFFISQVIEEWSTYRSRSMLNHQPKTHRRCLKKDPRLDLVKILPPPQPIASLSGLQGFDRNCGKAQNTIVSSVSSKSNDDIENIQNESQKKPKLDTETIEPESETSSSSLEFAYDSELQEALDDFEKVLNSIT